MQVTSPTSAVTPAPLAKKPQPAPGPQLPKPIAEVAKDVGPLRANAAAALRAIGAGYDQSSEMVGVVADKAYIYPVESAYAAQSAFVKATAKLPAPVAKYGGGALGVLGFLTAFHGMIIGSVLRSPGDVVKDVTHLAADQIDNQKTFDQQLNG
jgi:hypothetical protein